MDEDTKQHYFILSEFILTLYFLSVRATIRMREEQITLICRSELNSIEPGLKR